MADREREVVPRFNSEVAKTSTAVFLSVGKAVWRFKRPIICSRAKRARGNVDSEKFGEIDRGSSRENLKTETGDFVLNTLLNRKPVQFLKEGSDVLRFSGFEN